MDVPELDTHFDSYRIFLTWLETFSHVFAGSVFQVLSSPLSWAILHATSTKINTIVWLWTTDTFLLVLVGDWLEAGRDQYALLHCQACDDNLYILVQVLLMWTDALGKWHTPVSLGVCVCVCVCGGGGGIQCSIRIGLVNYSILLFLNSVTMDAISNCRIEVTIVLQKW